MRQEIDEKELQWNFEYAFKTLRYVFSLHITNNQLIRLHVYTKQAISNLYRTSEKQNRFWPSNDACMMFLIEEYGIPPRYKPAIEAVMSGASDETLNYWLRKHTS